MESKCEKCNQEPIYLKGLCKKCWDLEQSDKLDRIERIVNDISDRQLINGITPTVVAMMNKRGIIPELFVKLNAEQRIGLLETIKKQRYSIIKKD